MSKFFLSRNIFLAAQSKRIYFFAIAIKFKCKNAKIDYFEKGNIKYGIKTDFTLAINDKPSPSDIVVYPNPADEGIYIKTVNNDIFSENNYQIMISNINGHLVKMANLTEYLDVSSLSKGVYIMQIKSTETKLIYFTQKLIIQ